MITSYVKYSLVMAVTFVVLMIVLQYVPNTNFHEQFYIFHKNCVVALHFFLILCNNVGFQCVRNVITNPGEIDFNTWETGPYMKEFIMDLSGTEEGKCVLGPCGPG